MNNAWNLYKISSQFATMTLLTILIFSHTGCRQLPDQVSEGDIAVISPEKEESLEWFRDAKFGMFIHWGPYAQLGGIWQGKKIEGIGEWIMHNAQIPREEYREMARSFNPGKFDAKAWARLARETGMKYLVITAKHHDGFAMYNSKVSAYNIVNWTGFGRDPLKELADACEEQGIKFGVYYSHREDWDHPGGYGNDWDFDNDWGADFYHQEKFDLYLKEKAKPQLRELLTAYGPLVLVWFDRGMYTREQGMEFVRMVHDLQPGCLVNSRVGHYNHENLGDYQSMSDNGMPPGGLEEYWETPMTLNDTWGFKSWDNNWKSSEGVIRRLVEIVSRGGNYLLNIGPTGLGEIPAATMDIFSEVGAWVRNNAEAIYGAGANPFPEIPWGYCTTGENRLYLFVRDWPEDAVLRLTGMTNTATKAYFLINPSPDLEIIQTGDQTHIALPPEPPDNQISVIVLEYEGALQIDQQLVPQDDEGKVELNYLSANTHGRAVTRFNRKGGYHISKWTDPEDMVEWRIHISKPGPYKVNISYAANEEWEGKEYEITINDFSMRSRVSSTGDWYEYQTFQMGYFDFPQEGDYSLNIRPLSQSDTYLMYLKSITLEPVEKEKAEGWGVNYF